MPVPEYVGTALVEALDELSGGQVVRCACGAEPELYPSYDQRTEMVTLTMRCHGREFRRQVSFEQLAAGRFPKNTMLLTLRELISSSSYEVQSRRAQDSRQVERYTVAAGSAMLAGTPVRIMRDLTGRDIVRETREGERVDGWTLRAARYPDEVEITSSSPTQRMWRERDDSFMRQVVIADQLSNSRFFQEDELVNREQYVIRPSQEKPEIDTSRALDYMVETGATLKKGDAVASNGKGMIRKAKDDEIIIGWVMRNPKSDTTGTRAKVWLDRPDDRDTATEQFKNLDWEPKGAVIALSNEADQADRMRAIDMDDGMTAEEEEARVNKIRERLAREREMLRGLQERRARPHQPEVAERELDDIEQRFAMLELD